MSAQERINAAVGRSQSGSRNVALAIREAIPQIARRLPAFLGMPQAVAERYAAIAVGTIQDSPFLADCTPASIVRGVIRAAEYGLALDGIMGHAYLVPYSIKGVRTAQFQIGYRGLVELMYRTEMWVSVRAEVVCERDPLWVFEEGTTPFLRHRRALDDRGKRIAAYAVAHPHDSGLPTFVVLGEEDVLRHRAASKAFASKPAESIWEKYPDVAWRKSALRELSKSVAMATERHSAVRQAAATDERIDAGDETVMVDAVADECPPGEAVDMTTGEKT